MDKNLAVGLTAIVFMMVSMMGISTYSDIKMAEAGLQQCKVRTAVGYTMAWQKTCQEPQGDDPRR